MEAWIGYVQTIATVALPCVIMYYGQKYGPLFEKHLYAEIREKNATIEHLKEEIRFRNDFSPDALRKHTIAIKEQLEERISFLENNNEGLQRSNEEMQELTSVLEETKKTLEVEAKLLIFFEKYNEKYYNGLLAAQTQQDAEASVTRGGKDG